MKRIRIVGDRSSKPYISVQNQFDELTGFLKRHRYLRKLSTVLFEKKKGIVCLLDIDDFKMINDINGHRFGDLVLQEVASRIRRFSQIEHIVGRFSGDEYVIAFIDDVQKSPNEWKTLINELMFTLKQPMFIEGKKVVINASLGYSTFPEHSLDAEELVMYSEMAMFEAKRNGKNQYKEFKLTMNEALQLQTEIDELLKIHDKSSVFTMVYQPIVDALTKKTKAYEALIRMKDNRFSPLQIIGVAENSNAIQTLGRWITEEVVKQIAIWKSDNQYDSNTIIPIAVNFSCKQMMDIDYVLFLERLLKEYEVQPNELIIEITESIFMDTRYNGIDFINSFKKLGVTVALDDFGTGYSSLIYLTNINFDKVKLDRSFIHKLIDEKSVKVLSGIIHMLHSIDVTVVAEGVEDEIQSNTLLLCGCDELQGYYFGKPEKPERYQSN